ncbi:hypothetical protein [Paenibacillus sp. V4I5]|uniref:hypothetical protein n=1 Tax=Paenibacillus sp. V4I5 TaxID=3042306 RepID=UPI00278FDF86|nr:hypothetical protein [Paenibacillus sp. V4I5]MDQ0913860.1 hypothetical protein [Paenibacillus sp. V4I5]
MNKQGAVQLLRRLLAWDDLNEYLGLAYNDGIITDWKWVQSVRDKSMVYKDLILLKILIDERRRKKA